MFLPTISKNDLVSIDKNSLVIKTFIDNSQYQDLVDQMNQNRKYNNNKFDGFSDIQMIYFYIHRKKHIKRTRSEGTKREYTRNLLQFFKYCIDSESYLREDVEDFKEGENFKNLRPWHIDSFQNFLLTAPLGKGNKPYSPATIDSKVIVIKSFLKWLNENEYIEFALHKEFNNTSLNEADLPNKDLHYEEVKALIDYYKNHPINHALLTFLAMTGMRIQEIVNLKWKDIYYDIGQRKYRLKYIAKGNKPMDIVLPYIAFERIRVYRKRRGLSLELNADDESPLFATAEGKHYNYKSLSNYLICAISKTELPFLKHREEKITPHSFRHFFAIYSRQQGADIYRIQKRLGHSDPRTTQRYLESTIKKEEDVALLWDENAF